jgi:penicillin-binding protein 2
MRIFQNKFNLRQYLRKRYKRRNIEIAPEDILIDSSNIPEYDTSQLEGRLEKPISRFSLYSVIGFFMIVLIIFGARAINLQLIHGRDYLKRSQNNLFRPIPIFSGRGLILDRNDVELAWNTPNVSSDNKISGDVVAERRYATSTGLSHILGYVQYPTKDSNGFYYREDFEGVDGIEKFFNEQLTGKNGSRLIEVDARGNVLSQNTVRPPEQGKNIKLSIDSRLQTSLYSNIKDIAERVGFAGGAGIIMDVNNGEIIALTSYPEYSSQIMSDRNDSRAIRALLNNQNLPFLDRAVDGLYTPGSVVKPYIALGALNEGVIDSETIIHTTGSISIPNPYDKTKETVFRDWKNLGSLSMRQAIAMSSDAYFYAVGGGYKDQKGLGILKIDQYLRKFGFGLPMKLDFAQGKAGTIPTPEWKKKTFNEDWFVGDTYHTAIGQYGFQVTPLQLARAVTAIANGGTLIVPHIIYGQPVETESKVDVPAKYFKIVQEGMILGAKEGTSKAFASINAKIAAKSGTAELGVSKDKVNSWITGFWPYDNPKYAFVVMLERGSVHNLIGAVAAMKQEFEWMEVNTPQYLR